MRVWREMLRRDSRTGSASRIRRARTTAPLSSHYNRRRATQIARVPDRSDTNAIGSDLAAGPEHRTRSHRVDADGCRPAVVASHYRSTHLLADELEQNLLFVFSHGQRKK